MLLLEQSQPDLEAQDAGDGGVENGLLDESSLDRLLQMGEALVPKAQIHTGVEGESTRGDLVPRDPREPVDGQAVRHDEPVEAPVLAQQPREQGTVAGAGHPVDLVVGGHDGGGARADTGPGGGEVDLVELAQAEFRLGGVAAADGGTLAA